MSEKGRPVIATAKNLHSCLWGENDIGGVAFVTQQREGAVDLRFEKAKIAPSTHTNTNGKSRDDNVLLPPQ